MSDDDPVNRRAAEIRAEEAEAAASRDARDSDLRAERVRLVQKLLDALSERTPHNVECVESDEEQPHGALARFSFVKEGKAWTQIMFEFGIDRIDGEPGAREFLYYLEPTSGAFSIPNPQTGVARRLGNASEADVMDYAIAIAIEMMARVVASGGSLGSSTQIDLQLKEEQKASERRDRELKQQRARRFWSGCGTAIVWFFGILIAIGLLGSILRACGGA